MERDRGFKNKGSIRDRKEEEEEGEERRKKTRKKHDIGKREMV